MPIVGDKFDGWCCVYSDPPESEENKVDITDIPATTLKQWCSNKFRLADGRPCPIRLDHMSGKFDVGHIVEAKMGPGGATFVRFEIDMSKELGKEVGTYLDKCEKERKPIGCSIGHEVCVDLDTNVAQYYNIEEVSLCGRGARADTIILPPDLAKSLEKMTVVASKSNTFNSPVVSEQVSSNFSTLVRVVCSKPRSSGVSTGKLTPTNQW